MTGDSDYLAILEEMKALHIRKSADYGDDDDPLANVLAAESFGVPNWVGVMIRANDKMKQIQTFAKKGQLANESIDDGLMDLAAYALIALTILRRERNALRILWESGTPIKSPLSESQLSSLSQDHTDESDESTADNF